MAEPYFYCSTTGYSPILKLPISMENPTEKIFSNAAQPKNDRFFLKEENMSWPGHERIFSSWNGKFLKEKILRPILIAMTVFTAGERAVGFLCGARTIGTSSLWVLYTINFGSLILGSIEYQLQKRGEILNEYRLAKLNSFNLSAQTSATAQIEKLKSAQADNYLCWGFTLPLIAAACYFDRKSFFASGPLKFSMNFPSYFNKIASTVCRTPLTILPAIAALYGLHELSSLWFDVYGRLGYGGLRQGSFTNEIYSTLSTLVLGIPILASPSRIVLYGSAVFGMSITLSQYLALFEKGSSFVKNEADRLAYE